MRNGGIQMPLRGIAADAVIQRLAARQHSVVSRTQLRAADISADTIDRRMRAGVLHAVHRSVYRVGSEMPPGATEMAAVLACDGKVYVSHRSGGGLWQIHPPPPLGAPVELIAPRTDHGRKRDLQVRRVRTLRPGEVTVLAGIPITTPARTLLDLAGLVCRPERPSRSGHQPGADPDQHAFTTADLDRALTEALGRRLTSPAEMRRMLAAHPRQPGAGVLRQILGMRSCLTRSRAEKTFLALVRRAELPVPEVNVELIDGKVDFLWPARSLIVEIDGFAYHATAERFEKDRRRDAALTVAGYRVLRFTWRQVTSRREATVARLAQALGSHIGIH
jgi:very-short-patch-repair endonuclease